MPIKNRAETCHLLPPSGPRSRAATAATGGVCTGLSFHGIEAPSGEGGQRDTWCHEKGPSPPMQDQTASGGRMLLCSCIICREGSPCFGCCDRRRDAYGEGSQSPPWWRCRS